MVTEGQSSRRQAGFSLVEVLISAAAVLVVIFALISLLVSQQKEVKALFQKSDILELKNQMIQTLADPDVCSWQLKDKVLNVSSTTTTTKSPTTITLPQLYFGSSTASPVLAEAGQRLPASTNNVNVANIILKDIVSTGRPNQFMGTLEVSFDESSLVRSLRPISIQQVLNVEPTDPASAKRISSCGRGVAEAGGTGDGEAFPGIWTLEGEMLGTSPDQYGPPCTSQSGTFCEMGTTCISNLFNRNNGTWTMDVYRCTEFRVVPREEDDGADGGSGDGDGE